jgi:hypothetical protein
VSQELAPASGSASVLAVQPAVLQELLPAAMAGVPMAAPQARGKVALPASARVAIRADAVAVPKAEASVRGLVSVRGLTAEWA